MDLNRFTSAAPVVIGLMVRETLGAGLLDAETLLTFRKSAACPRAMGFRGLEIQGFSLGV